MIDVKEYEDILLGAKEKDPICHDSRPCFARNGNKCRILWSTYADGYCPFCKKNREDRK